MKSYKQITVNGKQVRLHRWLFEQYLGRKLALNEVVHHKDGDIHNNTIDNLQLTTRAEHKKRHPEIGKETRYKDKYVINKETLCILYVQNKLTIHQIADLLGATYGPIWGRLNKYGIKRRKQGRIAN